MQWFYLMLFMAALLLMLCICGAVAHIIPQKLWDRWDVWWQ